MLENVKYYQGSDNLLRSYNHRRLLVATQCSWSPDRRVSHPVHGHSPAHQVAESVTQLPGRTPTHLVAESVTQLPGQTPTHLVAGSVTQLRGRTPTHLVAGSITRWPGWSPAHPVAWSPGRSVIGSKLVQLPYGVEFCANVGFELARYQWKASKESIPDLYSNQRSNGYIFCNRQNS